MLEAGEDPLFVLRRMVIFAAEDVGNADPRALSVATAARRRVPLIGLPEGLLPMTQAVHLSGDRAQDRTPRSPPTRRAQGRRRRARRAARPAPPAQRARRRSRSSSAGAPATSTRTTSRATTSARSTCPRRSAATSTTSRRTRATRPRSPRASRSWAIPTSPTRVERRPRGRGPGACTFPSRCSQTCVPRSLECDIWILVWRSSPGWSAPC